MPDLIALPDAEEAVVAYLDPLMDGVRVGTRNPASPTTGGELVRVRRVGGISRSRVVDVPTLDVLVWADDHGRRMDLARRASALLHAGSGAIAGGARLGGCSDVMGPRRMPDPANDQAEVVMFTVALAMQATDPDEFTTE